MAGFVFSPEANKALDTIWVYTEETWGREQAETYIRDMMAHLGAVTNKEKPWRKLPRTLVVPLDLDVNVYMTRFQKHMLFFRELPSGMLGILSILHEKVDMPVRLAEDLRKLEVDAGSAN